MALAASHGEDDGSLLREGGVQLTSLSTLLSHHRFLFLYPHTLVISKQKGLGTFKTKEKVRVEDVWVSSTGHTPDSFLIGWPLRNFLVHFPNRREKEEWFGLLSSTIAARLRPVSTTIMMSILVRGRKQMIRRKIENGRRAGEIIVDTQTELGLPSASYDLKVQIGEGSPKVLQGPENVYCVIMHEIEKSGARLSESQKSSLDTCPVLSVKLLLSHLRTSRPSPQEMLSSLRRRLSRSECKSLFGRPLEGRTPPQPILSIIDHLRMHCTDTEGLFRKSPKQSTAKELRGELEKGLVPDYHKYNAHVLAATLKDYLRSIPNKLLLNGNYLLWMADVIEQENEAKKLSATRSLLSLLPAAHHILLVNLLRLLSKVASSPESLMSPVSLAVCLAPSFLDSADATSTKRIPELIAFLIEHAAEVLPSFSSPSLFSLINSAVDLNSNEVSSLHIEECTTPDPLSPPPSERDFTRSPLARASPLDDFSPTSSTAPPPIPSTEPPVDDHAPSTPVFRSKALRGENGVSHKKETPRSPCLKRIHFNAHLLKGGCPSRPSPFLSDSDSDGEGDVAWRPLAASTVDVPRKTSLERVEGARMEREAFRPSPSPRLPLTRTDLLPPLPERVEAPPPVPVELPPRIETTRRDDKPTVQVEEGREKRKTGVLKVLPFRAKEEERVNEEEWRAECKARKIVSRSLSQRACEGVRGPSKGELQRTSSVLSDRHRRQAPRLPPDCPGMDEIEINWSVAQLKRNFQSTRAPEIKTSFGE